MSYSRTASAGAVDDSYEHTLDAPPAGAAPDKVLITEQQVLFGSAPALSARRPHIGRRFGASRGHPKRYEFLERSLMAREMDRL
jgi:hypothetical protein